MESSQKLDIPKIDFQLSQNLKNFHNLDEYNLNDNDNYSIFDIVVIKSWISAMEMGLFKFKLEGKQPYRYLDGKYSFIAQLNEKRMAEKRPSDIKNREIVNQPFDKSKFNFTKINKNEILFKMYYKNDDTVFEAIHESEPNPYDLINYVLINVSPIDIGHVLLVPRLHSGHNQVLTFDSIRISVSCLLASKSSSILIGFNSINAYASVNHLHLHCYYVNLSPNNKNKYTFPIQNVQNAKRISQHLWYIDEDEYILPGFILQLVDFENDLNEFSRRVIQITNYLTEKNIPQNVVFVKSDILNNSDTTDPNRTTVRAIIWPKKPAHEIVEENDKFSGFAICELSGHFLISDKKIFDEIIEDDILRLSNFIKLDLNSLQEIKRDVENFFI